MKQLQIKINVHIAKVKLQVRFPCSLYALLKVDNEQVSFGSDVPLRLGQAYIQQSASLKCSIFYDISHNQFIQKKASVCLFLTTSSGRIPAGAAYININALKKGTTRQALNIQKCPDKNAFIQVKISYEILREIQQISNINHNKQAIISRQLISLRDYPSKEINSNRIKRSYHEQINADEHVQQQLNASKKLQANLNNEIQAFYHSRNNSNLHIGQSSQREYLNISSPSIDYTSRGKHFQLQKQLKNVNKKYEQLMAQLKVATTKRESLEKSLKDVEGQLKGYKETYQDLQESNRHQQRRDQYKQSTYKQQIKILTQKLGSSQNEKQLMIFQKNEMINQFEKREKTLRLGLKQKQKIMNEQKIKLAKKTQETARELNDAKNKYSQNEQKIAELVREKTLDTKRYELLQKKCQQIVRQNDKLRQLHTSQKSKRQALQESIKDQTEIEDEKKKLKRKINEGEQEISKLLNNITLNDSNLQKALKKTDEYEILLKEKSTLLKNMQIQNNNLIKEKDAFAKKIEESQKQTFLLVLARSNQAAHIQSLQDQIRQVQKKYLQEAKILKKDIKQKQSKIKMLIQEGNDHQQQIKESNKKMQQQSNQIQQLNQRVCLFSQEHEQTERKKDQLQQNIKQLQLALFSERKNKQEIQLSLSQSINNKQIQYKQILLQFQQIQRASLKKDQESQQMIFDLQEKAKNLENQVRQRVNQIQKLKETITNLELENSQKNSSTEQLQYSIKLKQREIKFLKDTLQKGSQQNIDLNNKISELIIKNQKHNQKQQQQQIQIQSLICRLSQTNESASQIQEQFHLYVKQNIENLNSFLSCFLNGQNISYTPTHTESSIQIIMLQAIAKVNSTYSQKDKKIIQLQDSLQEVKKELNEVHQQYSSKLRQSQQIECSLQQQLGKYRQNSQSFVVQITQLKEKLQVSNIKMIELQADIINLKQIHRSLTEEINILTVSVESKQSQNSKLTQRVQDLQSTIKHVEDQYSMYQSRESNKFEEQSTSLKFTISELQGQVRVQTQKYEQLTLQMNETRKYYQQFTRKTNQNIQELTRQKEKLNQEVVGLKQKIQNLSLELQDIKSKNVNLNSIIQNLQCQRQKLKEQISHRNSLIEQQQNKITLYMQNQSQLQDKLALQLHNVEELKENNEGLRQRIKKASSKERQLEQIVYNLKNGQSQLSTKQSDIQKALKEKTAQLISSCERLFALQQANKQLTIDLDFANALIQVKICTIKETQQNLKQLKLQNQQLNYLIKTLQDSSQKKQRQSQEQSSNLTKNIKLLQTIKQKLQVKIQSYEEQKINLTQQIRQMKQANKALQSQLSKNLHILQKTHSVQDQYLKPIRNNLNLLRGHLAEYSRVGDQFQSNKNKLLKTVSTKIDSMTDKYIHDRIKDFSLAYSKLKVFILNCQLNQQTKYKAGQQIKKVQLALDRVLRGEK